MSKIVVKRNMIIKSADQFYEIYNANFVDKSITLNISDFVYLYENWINGCMCDEELNRNLMLEEWKKLKLNKLVIDFLKDNFNCSDIIFQE